MRHPLFGLVVAAALTAAGCKGVTDVQPGEPFQLQVGQVAVVPDSSLALRFEAVPQDSRCPVDVQCIWAGDGVVRLGLRTSADSSTADLHTNPGAGSARVQAGAWTIELLSLAPAPHANHPIPAGDYIATLQVRRP